MYTEETKTIHGEFLKKIAEESGSSFTKIPAYKKSAPILIRENQVIPYTHAGIFDSHIDFFNARIPSVNFLSLNWEKESFEAIEERDGSINISNQKEDNLEYLADKVGKEKILIQLSSVFDVSYNALTDKEFVDVMMKSAENMPDYSIINSDVFYFVTILISAIVVLSLAAFLVKRARNNRRYKRIRREQEKACGGSFRLGLKGRWRQRRRYIRTVVKGKRFYAFFFSTQNIHNDLL